MKTFSRAFLVSAMAAGALAGALIKFAAADTQAAPSPAPSPYAVSIKNFAFSPSELRIPVGATVVWKNEDSAAHTATTTSKGFDSGELDQGKSFSFTFTKAGTYSYVCSYHASMTGKVIVGDK